MHNNQHAALRNYFLLVVRNLVGRGVLRKQAGQSYEQILRDEWLTVLNEIREDFTAVGAEMGLGLVNGAARALWGFVGDFLSGKAR
jgi:hypothetical protein